MTRVFWIWQNLFLCLKQNFLTQHLDLLFLRTLDVSAVKKVVLKQFGLSGPGADGLDRVVLLTRG